MRVLLHLVLERLLFSVSLCHDISEEKKILVLENGITLNRETNFDVVNILYKSYKGWQWASSLSDHSGSTDCLYGSSSGFPFALASPQTSGRSVYFSSLPLIPTGFLSESPHGTTGPQLTLGGIEAQVTLS